MRWRTGIGDTLRLWRLSARLVAGRRYWIAPLLPLVWSVFQIVGLLTGMRDHAFGPDDAQGVLIGFPLTILAIGFGVRIIAGEIDRRTLEIAYTVPGGAHRVWLAKLGASVVMLLAAELLLAVVTWIFFTAFPWTALYGGLQPALFYLVLSMALAALFRSEAAGGLVVMVVLLLNGPFQGTRISPFWNSANFPNADPADVLAWTLQNRIGFVLVILAITALAFGRAERREKLLGG